MLVSALRPKQKALFGAASPHCGLEGSEWHGTWKGSLRNELPHHYGTAVRSPSSCLDQPRRPPVPAAPIRWSGKGRMSTARSIHYWLPGKQWHGSPSIPHSPPGAWWPVGESQGHQSHHREGSSCKSGHTFRIKFGRCCNSWMLPSVWPTGPAWPITHVFPTVGTALGVSPTVPAHTDPRLGGKGEKTTLALKGLGLDLRLSATEGGPSSSRDTLGLLSPYHSRLQQGREHWARGQDVNWALKSPSEASPLLIWWCKTHDDPSWLTPGSCWNHLTAEPVGPQLQKCLCFTPMKISSWVKNSEGFNQHRISLSGDSHLSMQNISNVIKAMYFHKWNNYSWLHLLLVLKQYVLIDVNNYKGCWSSRPTLNSTWLSLITDL